MTFDEYVEKHNKLKTDIEKVLGAMRWLDGYKIVKMSFSYRQVAVYLELDNISKVMVKLGIDNEFNVTMLLGISTYK